MLVQLRNAQCDAEGFNAHRRQHGSIRYGKDVEVHRSPQAVACRKRYTVELGKPQWAPVVKTATKWYTVIEAMMLRRRHKSFGLADFIQAKSADLLFWDWK